MTEPVRVDHDSQGRTVYRVTTHRRTITETDIVTFVNLMGLHEPPFIDMEWVSQAMPGLHNKRFAPAPFLISLGMGLMAPRITDVVQAVGEREGLGPFHGMVGVEARVRAPAFPEDTLHVELEAFVDRKTGKGQTLVDMRHILKNQRGEIVVDFTEKILFEPSQ